MTTIRDLLRRAHERLATSETPALDALILLEWASQIPRETILAEQSASPNDLVAKNKLQHFLDAVDERATGRSIAYIVGEKEFYGRSFVVGPGVLVPRPDSETLVARALELLDEIRIPHGKTLHLHDCCTGSGCIGLSIALEYIELRSAPLFLTLSDVDDTALAWARKNADILAPKSIPRSPSRLTISLRHLDLLSTERSTDSGEGDREALSNVSAADLITANPPYLTTAETTAALAGGWAEPHVALDAGNSGMETIDRLIPQAFSHLRPGGYLIVEHGANQAAVVAERMRHAGFETVSTRPDLAGRDRCTEARKPE